MIKAYDETPFTVVLTDNKTLLASDSGSVFLIGTDAKVMTLPAVADVPIGTTYTFQNIGVDANNNIRVTPASADYIAGTATLASSVVDLGVTDNKYIDNTKASTIRGDSVTVTSDGTNGWTAFPINGIWASE